MNGQERKAGLRVSLGPDPALDLDFATELSIFIEEVGNSLGRHELATDQKGHYIIFPFFPVKI